MAASSVIGIDIAPDATFSMTNENATYPATNGNNRNPAVPLKASSTGTVITLTWSGNVQLEAFAVINHNLVGATVTLANGAGFSQAIAMPARTNDGQCVNGWLDMRALANTTDDVWTLTVSGASANVAIGELVAVGTLNDLEWNYGIEVVSAHPTIRHRAFYGSEMVYDRGIRIRRARGTASAKSDTYRTTLLSHMQSAYGPVRPFLLVPVYTVNDAWYVRLLDDSFGFSTLAPDAHDIPFMVEEVSSGLVL